MKMMLYVEQLKVLSHVELPLTRLCTRSVHWNEPGSLVKQTSVVHLVSEGI